MSTLGTAISIAAEAHDGQVDKAGAPYIFHPMRMVLKAKTDDERIVAALHDVLEDTEVDLGELFDCGFADIILSAVNALTRMAGEPYKDFIGRVALNPLARTVKILDLQDNMDLSRLPILTDADVRRAAKYRDALDRLLAHPNGDQAP